MLTEHVRVLSGYGDLTILSRQPDPDAPLCVEVKTGVTEYRLPFSGDRGVGGLLQLIRGARIWWQQHQHDFDVVISEQPFVMWALLLAGCRLPRLQVCYSFAFEEYATRHGLDWSLKHKFAVAAMRRIEGRVYASADAMLVLSEYTRRQLHESFGLRDDRIIDVVPGGVDLPALLDADARERVRRKLHWQGPVVVTLRNLVPRTGVDMLVQAAAIVRHRRPDVRWCVIGAGALMEPLKWLAGQLNVDDIVEFPGYLPEEEVVHRLQAADVFVLPTRSLEGFGLVTVEANANGLPVAGTPVGANPEVVASSPDNILADSINPESLADVTCLLLERPDEQALRAKRLRKHVRKHYSWKHHDEAFLRAVSALIA